MQLQHVMGAKLTLDSGETLILERLGKGQFHTCYVDRTKGQVYAVTIDRDGSEDHSKEILSHPQLGVDPNPHIPPVEYLGSIGGGDRRVYRMPLYQPLRAQHKLAWEQFRALVAARETAWKMTVKELHGKMRLSDWGFTVNTHTCTLMDSPAVSGDLRDALWDIRDAASNYGQSYCMEFSKRNCMVDGNGRLILLDVLFNLEAVEAIQKKKERRTA